MKKTTLVSLIILLLSFQVVFSQSIIGKWKTIDDETGEAKSIVEIYEESGKIYGKVVAILNPEKRDGVCEKCEDDRKDKPIIGMIIINGLEKDDDE